MPLPESVTKQGDAADALQKEIAEGTLVNVKDDNPSDKPTPQDKPVVEDKLPQTPDEELTYKQKFVVLQGKYDAEVPRLHEEMKRFREELATKTDTIRNLSAVINSMREENPPVNTDAPKESPGFQSAPDAQLNPEDFEGYGTEMSEMVKLVNKLISENNELKGKVQSVDTRITQSAEDKYFDSLSAQVQDWEEINNTDPGWHEWLKQSDPLSGFERQALLDDARVKLDVQRTARIFNSYKQEKGISQKDKPTTTPNENKLAGQVLPEETVVNNPAIDTGSVTKEQVQKASKDFVQGKITEEQFNAISNSFQKQFAKQGG